MPLAVSDFSIYVVAFLTPIPFVHLPNLSDLCTETPDFVAQNFEVIHATRIAHLDFLSVGRQSVRFWAVCALWRLHNQPLEPPSTLNVGTRKIALGRFVFLAARLVNLCSA